MSENTNDVTRRVHIWLDVKSEKIVSAGALSKNRGALENVWKVSSNKHYFKIDGTDYVVTSNLPVDMDLANLFAHAHNNGKFVKQNTETWD